MQKFGRLGLGGVAVLLAACGGKGVSSVGHVHGGAGGATAGAAGSGGSDVGRAGGGSPGGDAEGCLGCELVVAAANVLQFAANARAVYWIQRGTNNEFEEYNGDGALMARDLDSGQVSTLASGLLRPDYFGVSARYAYVFVSNDGNPVLRRYPLDSVGATAGEDVAPYYSSSDFPLERPAFAATQDFSYFRIRKQLHRIADAPDAKETLVEFDGQRDIGSIVADDKRLHFWGDLFGASGLYTVNGPGVAPTRLSDLSWDYLSVVDGYFYASENPYFSRLPATGGTWKRFADVDNAFAHTGLQVLGDYFYTVEERNDVNRAVIQRGALSAPKDRTDVVSYPHVTGPVSWLVTRTGVYWATDSGVYFKPSP